MPRQGVHPPSHPCPGASSPSSQSPPIVMRPGQWESGDRDSSRRPLLPPPTYLLIHPPPPPSLSLLVALDVHALIDAPDAVHRGHHPGEYESSFAFWPAEIIRPRVLSDIIHPSSSLRGPDLPPPSERRYGDLWRMSATHRHSHPPFPNAYSPCRYSVHRYGCLPTHAAPCFSSTLTPSRTSLSRSRSLLSTPSC